ncbi:hypothetical protein LTR08_003094 [Meristemomyces frigidus]|nr:hypothetical protein LTR08_003094 [Meristemomyces frigidus]
MHYTDPQTGLFHVGYLHNGAAGATTDDLVTYTDVNPDDPTFIRAGGKNDPVAVFDGSVIPSGINGTPTLLYTSVSYLPIHWTIPYTKGSETQSLAVTYNGGKYFTKLNQGPVIPGAPYGSVALNVTGFRDPYVFQNAELDRTYRSQNGTWYVAISGGVHDIGPNQFLYRQYSPEFRDWEYLGEWWSEPANSTWGLGTWAGRWGFNWEVGNVFTASEEGYDAEGDFFVTLGAEWGYAPVQPQTSQFREQLWASGNISTQRHGGVHFEPSMAGHLDWGMSAYAAAGKLVPASSQASLRSGAGDRFVIYLWLTNDHFGDLDFPVVQQGWGSSLTTPRELRRGHIADVVDNDLVSEVGSWRIVSSNAMAGTVGLSTLGQKMVREATHAYVSNATSSFSEVGRTVVSSPYGAGSTIAFSQSPDSRFYMMTASITFPALARGNKSDVKAGFKILSSEYESTLIYYQLSNESLIIDRSNSSAAAQSTNGIATDNEAGRLRLFDIKGPAETSSRVETLELTILVDNGVVEVYANDRFVISTWVWAWYATSNQIAFFHEGPDAVEFGEVKVHEGLVDAWPERSQ